MQHDEIFFAFKKKERFLNKWPRCLSKWSKGLAAYRLQVTNITEQREENEALTHPELLLTF